MGFQPGVEQRIRLRSDASLHTLVKTDSGLKLYDLTANKLPLVAVPQTVNLLPDATSSKSYNGTISPALVFAISSQKGQGVNPLIIPPNSIDSIYPSRSKPMFAYYVPNVVDPLQLPDAEALRDVFSEIGRAEDSQANHLDHKRERVNLAPIERDLQVIYRELLDCLDAVENYKAKRGTYPTISGLEGFIDRVAIELIDKGKLRDLKIGDTLHVWSRQEIGLIDSDDDSSEVWVLIGDNEVYGRLEDVIYKIVDLPRKGRVVLPFLVIGHPIAKYGGAEEVISDKPVLLPLSDPSDFSSFYREI